MSSSRASHHVVSPVLRREDAQARRQGLRAAKRLNPLGDRVLDTYKRAWNAVVDIDHLGRMARANRELSRIFGGSWQNTTDGPVIAQALADYRERREKANGPLRKKTTARLKHLPVVGPGEILVKQVFKARGVHRKNVLNAKIQRHGHGGYSVHFTQLVAPKVFPNRLAKIKHKGTIQNVGLCPTPDGLDIVTTQVNGKKAVAHRVAPSDFIKPGFAWDLLRHYLLPKTDTVALDQTFLPLLPGDLRHATSQLRRVLRSRRKAVGAIDYAEVSSEIEEIEEAHNYAKKAGVPRNTRRLMRTVSIHQCLCGAPRELRLDPVTLIPARRRTSCPACGAVMDTGHVLALRASAYHLDNRETYGHAGCPR